MTDEQRVSRFDFSSIDTKPTKTQQGFLRVHGQISRTGVLEYKTITGETRRELRHPEDVFSKDSMDSLKGAPITDLHHGMVGPPNVAQYGIGVTGETVVKDGNWLTAPLTIQREDSIKDVEARKRSELSPGYTCVVEHKPGMWEGEHYDARQRSILYNHVAIGPEGWARGGRDAVMRMDGLDVTAAASGLEPKEIKPVESGEEIRADDKAVPEEKKVMSNKQINLTLAGVDYDLEIAEPLASNFEQGVEQLREDGDAAKSRVSELEGQLAAEQKARHELQEKYDSETSESNVEKEVNARLKLRQDALKIAPELDCDEKNPRELKVAALAVNGWEVTHFDGKDEAYLDGVFASAVKMPKAPKQEVKIPSAKPEDHEDGQEDKPDAKKSYKDMCADGKDAWKRKQ